MRKIVNNEKVSNMGQEDSDENLMLEKSKKVDKNSNGKDRVVAEGEKEKVEGRKNGKSGEVTQIYVKKQIKEEVKGTNNSETKTKPPTLLEKHQSID